MIEKTGEKTFNLTEVGKVIFDVFEKGEYKPSPEDLLLALLLRPRIHKTHNGGLGPNQGDL